MAPWMLPLFYALIFVHSSHLSFAKFPPRYFPSSLIRPDTTSSPSNNEFYKTKYFTQNLDHFNYNPQSYQTFQQRYLINDTFWGGNKINAPIFVYTGNEGNIEWFAQNTGFMYDIAPEFKALLVFIEHRFYGKSIPYGGDKKKAYKNSKTLGYLSSTQALADYATLIIDLKKNLTAMDSPVIVFGGSYGGMLAAWFRLKYPHVAIGALSSSSPILQFENITSQYSFNNIITQDFRSESENCYKVIKGSWKQIEDTAAKHGGLELLRKSFHICKNYMSGGYLEGWLSTAFVYTAMTDYPTPSNFLSPMPAYPIKEDAADLEVGIPVVASSSKGVKGSTTPIVEKIGKIEKLIIEGKVTLVDDEGKPLKKVDSTTKVGNPFSKVGNVVVSDSDDDEVFDDHIGTLYSESGGKEQSLYKQWKADTGDDNNYDDDFGLSLPQLKAAGIQDFYLN